MNFVDQKIHRNAPCPCGSAKKYKHCCGSYVTQAPSENGEDARSIAFQRALAEHEAKETRRRQQQGLGRPIISTEFAEHRIVAVGDTVHWSKQWGTFHDFLFGYIRQIFGTDWGVKEQEKPLGKRHILLRWANEISEYHEEQRAKAPNARVLSSPATPVLSAYLGLAYNLYLMKHNAQLQRVLIERLKNPDESSFHGAYYETFVTATFIKAGYTIEFENEQDGSSTHCEFVATSADSKIKFSVEAKARFRGIVANGVDPKSLKLGVKDKIQAALQKKADYSRVIFVDVNLPETHVEGQTPFWVSNAIAESRDLEGTMTASGQETPAAYVIITNNPYQFETRDGISAAMEGFNIPEFKVGHAFPNLRAALDSRSQHAPIIALFQSMQIHNKIPSTFDGEMPELHFAASEERVPSLKIGGRYLIPGPDGIEVPAELESGIVIESQKQAHCIYRQIDNNIRFLAISPLTDRELAAYKSYPETFFGTVDRNATRKCSNVIDWYDFLFETYSHTSKEKLLEFMKDWPDVKTFKAMPQDEIAKIYCERLAQSIDGRNKKI